MKNYLIYDPETKIGVTTVLRCEPKHMEAFYDPIEEPYIEIGETSIDEPADWIVEEGVAVKRDKPITSELVNAERDRRIEAGFTFNGHSFDFDAGSKENITGAGALAGTAIALGATQGDTLWHGGADPFQWITSDNTKVDLDAHQMFAMSQAAAEHVRLHVMAARALKDMETIPVDYQADSHWP